MAQLINEAKRMQFLAGIITESQLSEEKVGHIDVNAVKQVIDTPEVEKIANVLKNNPEDAKKLAAALSDPKAIAILSGKSISESEDEKEYSIKERIMRFLKYAGVGSIAGAIFAPIAMLTPTTTSPEASAMLISGAIVGAIMGALGGALGTDGFTRKSFEEADNQINSDLKDKIAQVLAFGKK